ncbi:MAG TPA: DUF924 family protein [Acetobacteraceae bacterium]|jgi:uncharacterized protein (DUF924 family)
MPEMQPDLSHRAGMLLDFWFAPDGAPEHDRLRDIWFHATPEFDAALAEDFRADYERAVSGVYEPWRNAPQTCLALTLLLDQLPRNVFRNMPQSYATDAAALEIAHEAVARGYDHAVVPVRRCFFYLPFQHSESLADQETAERLYAALPEHHDRTTFVEAARQHHAIIARFGRFPHRNGILARATTAEEQEFLKQPGTAF